MNLGHGPAMTVQASSQQHGDYTEEELQLMAEVERKNQERSRELYLKT